MKWNVNFIGQQERIWKEDIVHFRALPQNWPVETEKPPETLARKTRNSIEVLSPLQAYNFTATPTCSVQYDIAVLIYFAVIKFWCEAYGQHVFVLNNSAPISTECSDKSSLIFIFATRTLWRRFLKASILHASTRTWGNQIWTLYTESWVWKPRMWNDYRKGIDKSVIVLATKQFNYSCMIMEDKGNLCSGVIQLVHILHTIRKKKKTM